MSSVQPAGRKSVEINSLPGQTGRYSSDKLKRSPVTLALFFFFALSTQSQEPRQAGDILSSSDSIQGRNGNEFLLMDELM